MSNGDAISTWTDLSGNGNDLSGGVAPNYDGASNMVNFDSGDHLTVFDRDSLRISGGDHSMIIVLHPDATDHNDFISTWGVSSGHALMQFYNNKFAPHVFRGSHSNWVYAGDNVSTEQAGIFTQVIDESNTRVKGHVNGVHFSNRIIEGTASDASDDFSLGARSASYSNAYFDGRIAEVLIFNKELTNSELAQINSYLANKWSLTTTVDSDNDGFTDAVEIAAGTDPTDDASLAITYPDFSDAVDAEIGTI